MQTVARPGFPSEAALGLVAQLTQSRPGLTRPILVLGQICEIFTDQRVHRGVSLGGMPANNSEDIGAYAMQGWFQGISPPLTQVRTRRSRLPATMAEPARNNIIVDGSGTGVGVRDPDTSCTKLLPGTVLSGNLVAKLLV